MNLCGLGGQKRDAVVDKVEELGRDGFRALGVARTEGGGWTYLGILPLLDPPRPDSAQVVADARGTGSMCAWSPATMPRSQGRWRARSGSGRTSSRPRRSFAATRPISTRKKKQQVLAADGFAEVTPEHKFAIVKAFQAGDRIVGMTGDGVNDAPALKQADVGFAVSGATDAARAAADLVLTEPGLGVIIGAVEEARRIFERMVSYATFRITETSRVLVFIAASILAFRFYPVTRDHDRAAGDPERHPDHDDRHRQCPDREASGALAHAPRADPGEPAGDRRRRGDVRAVPVSARLQRLAGAGGADRDLSQAADRRAFHDLS